MTSISCCGKRTTKLRVKSHTNWIQETYMLDPLYPPAPPHLAKRPTARRPGARGPLASPNIGRKTIPGSILLCLPPTSLPEHHNEGSNLYGHLDSCDASSPLDVCHRGSALPSTPPAVPSFPSEDNASSLASQLYAGLASNCSRPGQMGACHPSSAVPLSCSAGSPNDGTANMRRDRDTPRSGLGSETTSQSITPGPC